MKKLLLLMIVLLVSGAVMAQGKKETATPKSFIVFHAGPSIPAGDFSSKSLTNTDAGFAKTGYNLNLNYGYKFIENLGLTASVFYNNNKLNNATIREELEKEFDLSAGELSGLKLDHWKWYGITAGPMLMHNFTPNLAVDLRVMGGIANANTPKIVFEGKELVNEDWAVAPVFQTGIDLRIGLGTNIFFIINMDYLYMKPEFKMINRDFNSEVISTETVRQKMSVINLTGGFGIRF